MSNGNGSAPVELPEIVVTPGPQQGVNGAAAPAPFTGVPTPYANPNPAIRGLVMRGSSGGLLPAQVPYPPEVAEVIVGGYVSHSWETVEVQINYAEAWPLFKFQTAEGVNQPVQVGGGLPVPLPMYMPGQYVQIKLGGKLAATGIIMKRQTAYDASHHQVQFEGHGVTWLAARASHVDRSQSGQTGNFDGKTFLEAAIAVLAPFAGDGVGYTVVGNLDSTPFVRLQIEPGETIWNFLERIARPRGVVVGTDPYGNFIFTGTHSGPAAGDALIEGVNIKSCNSILSIENIYSEYDVRGQTAGDDSNNGSQASEQQGTAAGALGGYANGSYSPNLTPAEQPVWGEPELQKRAQHEHEWHDFTFKQAVITVYGWLQQNGELWQAGQFVLVKSPMAALNEVMAVQRVTFAQDSNRGTTTTLDLVMPGLLQGSSIYNVATPESTDVQPPPPVAQPQYKQGSEPPGAPTTQQTPTANPFASPPGPGQPANPFAGSTT